MRRASGARGPERAAITEAGGTTERSMRDRCHGFIVAAGVRAQRAHCSLLVNSRTGRTVLNLPYDSQSRRARSVAMWRQSSSVLGVWGARQSAPDAHEKRGGLSSPRGDHEESLWVFASVAGMLRGLHLVDRPSAGACMSGDGGSLLRFRAECFGVGLHRLRVECCTFHADFTCSGAISFC